MLLDHYLAYFMFFLFSQMLLHFVTWLNKSFIWKKTMNYVQCATSPLSIPYGVRIRKIFQHNNTFSNVFYYFKDAFTVESLSHNRYG